MKIEQLKHSIDELYSTIREFSEDGALDTLQELILNEEERNSLLEGDLLEIIENLEELKQLTECSNEFERSYNYELEFAIDLVKRFTHKEACELCETYTQNRKNVLKEFPDTDTNLNYCPNCSRLLITE